MRNIVEKQIENICNRSIDVINVDKYWKEKMVQKNRINKLGQAIMVSQKNSSLLMT